MAMEMDMSAKYAKTVCAKNTFTRLPKITEAEASIYRGKKQIQFDMSEYLLQRLAAGIIEDIVFDEKLHDFCHDKMTASATFIICVRYLFNKEYWATNAQ